MTRTTFTRRLLNHDQIEELRSREIPSDFPETPLDMSDYVLHREYAGIFIAIREGSTVRTVRVIVDHAQKDLGRGILLDPREDDTDISDIYRFLSSDYLHTPRFHFRGHLLGHNPESGLCYGLDGGTIKTYDPKNCGATIFDNLSFWGSRNRSLDFDPDLKAVLAPEEGPNINDTEYKYVFSEAVFEVDVRRDKPRLNVIPFVYDGAWEDYIEEVRGEIIRVEGDYRTKLVSEQI